MGRLNLTGWTYFDARYLGKSQVSLAKHGWRKMADGYIEQLGVLVEPQTQPTLPSPSHSRVNVLYSINSGLEWKFSRPERLCTDSHSNRV